MGTIGRSFLSIPAVSAIMLLLGGQALWAEDSQRIISLPEAVRLAILNRPDLKAQFDRANSAREKIGEARAANYPQLQASFQTVYGNSLFGFFLFPGYNYADLNLLTVTLTQTIYDFGRTGSSVTQNGWEYSREEAREKEMFSNTVRAVETDYFNLLSAQHQVKADEENLADASSQLDRARSRFHAGTGIVLDVTRARVNVESARLQMIRGRDQVRSLGLDLARVMGFSGPENLIAIDVDRDPNFMPHPDLQQDLALALEKRPEMIEATAQVHASEALLQNAKSQNYPSISGLVQSFTAMLPKSTLPIPYVPNNSPYSTFNVGGVVNIPILEGGLVVHQTSRAHSDLSASIESRRDINLQVTTDLKKAMLEIRDAGQRLKEARTERMNAQKNESLVEEAYRVGSVHSVDVMDAQAMLRQARESVIQARYALMIGYVDYQYARGTLNPPAGGGP